MTTRSVPFAGIESTAACTDLKSPVPSELTMMSFAVAAFANSRRRRRRSRDREGAKSAKEDAKKQCNVIPSRPFFAPSRFLSVSLMRRIPVVVAAQDVLDRVLRRFVVGQLARPGDALGAVGARAGAFVFAVAGGFL